ncbi:MAG: glycosyltransferase [Chitinophagaceae bacterium]
MPAPTGISPGQRFRFEHYLGLLEKQNIRFYISNFYSPKGWKILYTPGNKFRKVGVVLSGMIKRLIDLFRMRKYPFVYMYREAAPVGPPVFEWIMAKILRKKIIYDFDDAIWVPVMSEYNKAAAWIKNFGKVAKICRWSYKVSVGNQYLADYAKKNNDRVVLIPTVVDTDDGHNILQDHQTNKPAIGWTGTFSTLPYLDMVLPVLNELQEIYDFTFFVIADKDPRLPLKNYRFIKWNRETEAQDLLNFHIGLMPLYNDEISKGKCGFKAIQYMSLGIPAVVSPVGVNETIVDDGINGFVCEEDVEWKKRLSELLTDSSERKQLGLAAREKIEKQYSVKSMEAAFLDLFDYSMSNVSS